jgi:hypothetical protein
MPDFGVFDFCEVGAYTTYNWGLVIIYICFDMKKTHFLLKGNMAHVFVRFNFFI